MAADGEGFSLAMPHPDPNFALSRGAGLFRAPELKLDRLRCGRLWTCWRSSRRRTSAAIPTRS
jgi:hypothetical protein